MKKFILSVMALIAGVTMNANAQEIDTSGWKAGDDIAGYLNWGDYDGTFSGSITENANGDYDVSDLGQWWKGSKFTEYNKIGEVGAYGFYFDGKSTGDMTNVYQVVYIPAGFYTIKVQALYREGTPYDNFVNHFNNIIKKNAWLYADVLSSEDNESEVTRSFTKYVRSLATSEQTERLYYVDDGNWKNDYAYDYTNEEGVTTTYYCPCCVAGAIAYFANGCYENEMNLVLTQGAYVKIGFRKTANIAQDWLLFNNFRIEYNGPADESAQLVLALDDYDAAYTNVESIRDNIGSKGYGALMAIIDDKLMDLDDTVERNNLSSVLTGTENMNKLYDEANEALHTAYDLADLISNSEDMLASTDFPGKADFQSTYESIVAKAGAEDPAEINNDISTYITLFNELSKARADYLNTGEADEKGAKDFTSLIKYPWFVNPEYNPSYINGAWQLTADGWTDGMGGDNYNNVKNGRTDIASKVVLSSDETVTNQWYKYVNYTAGWSGGLNLYYQGHLIGVSDGWNSGLTGTMEIRQQLVGLPNGYYSLKALVRGNGSGSWSESNLPPYHNIFAENSEEVVVASPVGHTDSYVFPQYGWYEWNPSAWQEHKTGIIQVPDGKLLIGGQTSMVGNFTGFRLFYYGENPAFDEMIQDEINEVRSMYTRNNLSFAGDSLYIDSLLKEIVLPLASATAYEEAFANTTEAKKYIQAAGNVMKNYTTPADYEKLSAQYPTDSLPTQAAILAPAIEYIGNLGKGNTDTYQLVPDAESTYTAYKNYLAVYDVAVALGTDKINDKLAEQSSELQNAYSDVEVLKQYVDELTLLVNEQIIRNAGGETASEANPVNITSFLTNADFTAGPTTGWYGTTATTNEFARGNAEIWNASSIDFYQDVSNLPEGLYEVRARAFYRDAVNISDNDNASYTSWWTDANGDAEAWVHHYTQLYAKTASTEEASYVKSICDGKFTAPSFNRYEKQIIEGDILIDENGDIVYDENGNEIYLNDTVWMYYVDTTYVEGTQDVESTKLHGYPFDEQITVEENVYYYPSSMYGAYCRFAENPEAYNNSVRINVAEGETLRLGLRKSTSIYGDWVIFDDFELYYLGGNLDTGITEVETNVDKANGSIYNLAGQKVSHMNKGIYIKDGKKILVK